MPVNVQIQGMDSLMRHFAALDQVAQNQLVERALVAGALLIANAAKEKAPYLTGTLRRSIHVGGHESETPGHQRPPEDQRTRESVPGAEYRGAQTAVYVGTDVVYAAQREFGGEIRPRNASVLHFFLPDGTEVFAKRVVQAATPYLRPAADEQGAAAAREVGEAFRDLIRYAVGT